MDYLCMDCCKGKGIYFQGGAVNEVGRKACCNCGDNESNPLHIFVQKEEDEDFWDHRTKAFMEGMNKNNQPDSNPTLSDGKDCIETCNAYKELWEDKAHLAEALREIYRIRGEDEEIEILVNVAFIKGNLS